MSHAIEFWVAKYFVDFLITVGVIFGILAVALIWAMCISVKEKFARRAGAAK